MYHDWRNDNKPGAETGFFFQGEATYVYEGKCLYIERRASFIFVFHQNNYVKPIFCTF